MSRSCAVVAGCRVAVPHGLFWRNFFRGGKRHFGYRYIAAWHSSSGSAARFVWARSRSTRFIACRGRGGEGRIVAVCSPPGAIFEWSRCRCCFSSACRCSAWVGSLLVSARVGGAIAPVLPMCCARGRVLPLAGKFSAIAVLVEIRVGKFTVWLRPHKERLGRCPARLEVESARAQVIP